MPTLPPTGLPIEEGIASLRAALAEAPAAVLEAPPGAGKTTVVPLRLLDEPWLAAADRVLMLEPRRLATRAAARRMAALLGEHVGATVGYATRDERVVGPDTRVEVVTEGILTRRLQRDRTLAGIGLVIFDEVHERNLHTDMALALMLDTRDAAPATAVRILAMSATADTGPLAALIGGRAGPVPVLSTPGRQHPVEVRWTPPPPRSHPTQAVARAVSRALREQGGDVLVFLAGAGDIRRAETMLKETGLNGSGLNGSDLGTGVDVRPLFGALPLADQDLALSPSPPGRRRVVLSTDIAETSLTVEGVGAVVDAGQVRRPHYDPRTGLTRLRTVATSRSSADQRSGRAGRTGPGVAYRLWSKLEHAARRPFPVPEIATVDLADVVLELAVWGRSPAQLAFLDPPPERAVEEAAALLRALGALDAAGRPTELGRAMVELPLHPRLARMVVEAAPLGLGWEACVVAGLLQDRDVLRGRPDDLPVDLAARMRLVADRGARHPAADGAAVASARRQAELVARRAGVRPGAPATERAGEVLALAYPDRVAQSRGNGRFRLSGGGSAWVPRTDPLAAEPFLAVAEIDAGRRDSRIRVAAPVDAATATRAAGPETQADAVVWDEGRDDLRRQRSRRAGALELAHEDRPAGPGATTAGALLDRVRATRLGALRWTPQARSLQQRVAFARRTQGDHWPDLSDEHLLATVEEWLAPHLQGATGRRDLEALDLARLLGGMLPPDRRRELAELAPETVLTETGHRLSVDYSGDHPATAARVQELFGTTRHPMVGAGRVPLRLELLSPAGRPVQVTSDLGRFWTGSYADVRRDLAGRYPKHDWPTDPARARPPGPKRSGGAARSKGGGGRPPGRGRKRR